MFRPPTHALEVSSTGAETITLVCLQASDAFGADGMELDCPGCEIWEVRNGVNPGFQTQQGSPSSSPLVNPSPSESAEHSAPVHALPLALKAMPGQQQRH